MNYPAHIATSILLAACASTPTEDQANRTDPAAPAPTIDTWLSPELAGPWGSAVTETTATGRDGVILPTWIWYPTDDTSGFTTTYAGVLEGAAIEDAAPACDATHPVVLFSHGNTGLAYQSFFLTEHLASRGFIVVAPNHTGNTAFDDADATVAEMTIRRPLDIADAFDHAVALSQSPGSLLQGCIDPDAGYAVIGHSFGGYTALAVSGAPLNLEAMGNDCAGSHFSLCDVPTLWEKDHPGDTVADVSDPRVWASVPIAPLAVSGHQGTLDKITVPTLVIAAEEDLTTPWTTNTLPIWEGLATTPRYLAGISPAGHFSFTHFCVYLDDGCDPKRFLPVEEVYTLTNTLVSAFLADIMGETRADQALPPTQQGINTWREDL